MSATEAEMDTEKVSYFLWKSSSIIVCASLAIVLHLSLGVYVIE